jgi:DUF4097 and DUF4098 domain-containing protein YvlB
MMVASVGVAAGEAQQRDFRTDTTFTVPAGTRLHLDNAGGEVRIRTWDRSQVRVQAQHSSRVEVGIHLANAVLRLEPRGMRGFAPFAGVVDYVLTVPATMDLEVSGLHADLDIEGTRGEVKAHTMQGDIVVRGGSGRLSLSTLHGRVVVQGARGFVEAHAMSDDIEITDVAGEVSVQAVSGNIRLTRVTGRRIEASTVSGDVTLDTPLRNDGTYTLATHSGDVRVVIPEQTNALIRASAASGSVRATFPLPAEDRTARRWRTFRLGSGSATIELETFSGDIRLVRPGELPPPDPRSQQEH